MLFLSKDDSLAIPLAEGLLRYWPFGNSLKETLFLSELIEVIEVCEMSKLEPLVPRIFKRLMRCISGPQLQVSQFAMHFLKNDYFVGILRKFKQATILIIFPVIVGLSETHWNKIVRKNLNDSKTIIKEIDPVAFEIALQEKNSSCNINSLHDMHNLPERAAVERQWELLIKRAQSIDSSLIVPKLPYVDHHVVGLHNMNCISLDSSNLIQKV